MKHFILKVFRKSASSFSLLQKYSYNHQKYSCNHQNVSSCFLTVTRLTSSFSVNKQDLLKNPNSLKDYFPVDSYEQKTINKLYKGLLSDHRACLAESITLVESRNMTKRMMGQVLLQSVTGLKKETNIKQNIEMYLRQNNMETSSSSFHSLRIGITGPPGAGKSTFIESFGTFLITELGLKVAVLAVDPSSSRTGGSLLGDKTRMPKLSVEPLAYVRPSPSKGELGGVARNTMEALLLCEAAGYDIIIVETVGVGQSEVAVADMTDMFILLIPPAGGDELQGLKRGIIENCDFVLINKADGDLLPAARRIQTEYTSALKFIPRKYKDWRPRVRRVSALTGSGISDTWDLIIEFCSILISSGMFDHNRKNQRNIWMWNHIRSNVLKRFKADKSVKNELKIMKSLVETGDITPGLASDLLLDSFFNKK